MFEVDHIAIRKIRLPFKTASQHAVSPSHFSTSVIFEVHLKSGEIGYGECVPRRNIAGETLDSIVTGLKSIQDDLLERRLANIDVIPYIQKFDWHYPGLEHQFCVQTAFELAMLDAFGKHQKTNAINLIGGARAGKITYSGLISSDGPQFVEAMAEKFYALGMCQLKLKVGHDLKQDLEHVDIIRKVYGSHVDIRIDANGAWKLQEAISNLDQFATYGVTCCEQPMPKHADYFTLREALKGRIKICHDESLVTLEDGSRIIQERQGDVFNLRICKNGGIFNALKLHDLARSAGTFSQLGSQVGETSLLAAAGRIFALMTGDLLFHEGSLGLNLLDTDITQEPLQFGRDGIGNSDFLMNPGLGIIVDVPKLKSLTFDEWSS